MYDLLKFKDDKVSGSGEKKRVNLCTVKKKAGQRYDAKGKVAWSEVHQKILDELINHLQSPDVIAYPIFTLPFFMNTDASNEGLGAVLYQKQNGVDRVISYASRTLTDAEKNYHIHSGK